MVHEIPVVRHQYKAAGKLLQEIFEHVECVDVKVIRWLIQNQEIGTCHEQLQQLQSFLLSPTELLHKRVLLVWRKKKIIKEFGSRNLTAI